MDPWVERYMEGMKLYGQQDYAAAAAKYAEALELAPDNTEVLHALAAANMHGGELDEAIKVANRIVELDPNDHLVHTTLSMIYVRKEDIDAAEAEQAKARMKAWKQELKDNPDAPPPDEDGMKVIQ